MTKEKQIPKEAVEGMIEGMKDFKEGRYKVVTKEKETPLSLSDLKSNGGTGDYYEEDVKEAVSRLNKELGILTNIVYGNSPDTYNLDSFKGLIKNQLYILEKRIRDEIMGEFE